MALYRFGQVILAVWLVYKFVVLIPHFRSYGIAGFIGAYVGGNLFDLRTWLLVVGLFLLRWKYRRGGTKDKI
jgi:hypothetical protein